MQDNLDILWDETTRSAEETKCFGRRLASLLNPGDVVVLSGNLGAGKTTFVQGVAEGLVLEPGVFVTSPTFTLIQEYPARRGPLFHIDFYRLEREKDLETLGLEEYFFGRGITLVEWGERFPNIFPPKTLWIFFKIQGSQTPGSQTPGEQERRIYARGSKVWGYLRRELGKN